MENGWKVWSGVGTDEGEWIGTGKQKRRRAYRIGARKEDGTETGTDCHGHHHWTVVITIPAASPKLTDCRLIPAKRQKSEIGWSIGRCGQGRVQLVSSDANAKRTTASGERTSHDGAAAKMHP